MAIAVKKPFTKVSLVYDAAKYRQMVVNPEKIYYCMSLFAFLALTAHRTQQNLTFVRVTNQLRLHL